MIKINILLSDQIKKFLMQFILEKSSQRILFVVNEKNNYLGTITDGDIRRGLLNKLTLDSKKKNYKCEI